MYEHSTPTTNPPGQSAAAAPASEFRQAVTLARDPTRAAQELYDGLVGPTTELVVLFCSSRHDFAALGAALKRRFAGIPVIGTTASGEITPKGYIEGSIAGLAMTARDASVVSRRLDDLSGFRMQDGSTAAAALVEELEAKSPGVSSENTFALLLIDSLRTGEERVVAAIGAALGGIPLIGGSAADDRSFQHTHVFHDGAFRRDAAVITLIRTRHPFRTFSTHHFECGDAKAVITAADPNRRLVFEINAEPAAREYARLCGIHDRDINSDTFIRHPMLVKIGENYYVRGIETVNDDGSLHFACAIDSGIVVTFGKPTDMYRELKALFDDLKRDLGPLALVIGCDCWGRKYEMEQMQLAGRISKLMMANNAIGFATFGEQINSLHVNHSFTGIALGSVARDGAPR